MVHRNSHVGHKRSSFLLNLLKHNIVLTDPTLWSALAATQALRLQGVVNRLGGVDLTVSPFRRTVRFVRRLASAADAHVFGHQQFRLLPRQHPPSFLPIFEPVAPVV